MAFQGDLSNINLAGVFQNLMHNAQSGTLTLTPRPGSSLSSDEDEPAERFLYFRDGRVRMYSAGRGSVTPLGSQLVAQGKLREKDLASAEKKRGKSRSLTSALHKMGVEKADITAAVRRYILEEVYDLFTWKSGDFRFDEGEPLKGVFDEEVAAADLTIPVNEVILEAARRMDEWDRIYKYIASPREVYVLRRERVADIQSIKSPGQRVVAGLLDGRQDVAAIVQTSRLGRFLGYKALAEMIRDNLARPVSTADLIDHAEKAESVGNHDEAARLYRRVLEVERNNLDARKRLAAILEAGGESQEAATEHKVLANALLDNNDQSGAIAAFEKAIVLVPNDTDCRERCLDLLIQMGDHSTAARVGTELAQTYATLGLGEKARDTYARLLTLPLEAPASIRLALAETCVKIGQILEAVRILKAQAAEHVDAQRDNEAARILRRAVEIDPNDLEAQRQLKEIESGQLERRRVRRRQLKRMVVALVIAMPLLFWFLYDVKARMKFDQTNRSAHKKAVSGQLETLETIPAMFRDVAQKYPLSWAAGEASRLEQTYIDIISERKLDQAERAKDEGNLLRARGLYQEVRTGRDKPSREIQARAELGYEQVRKALPATAQPAPQKLRP